MNEKIFWLLLSIMGFPQIDHFDQNRGFIYLLKNDLIDITDILSSREDDNFLKRFIYDEDGIVLNLYEKFADFEKRYPETFYRYFKTLNDDWQYYLAIWHQERQRGQGSPNMTMVNINGKLS